MKYFYDLIFPVFGESAKQITMVSVSYLRMLFCVLLFSACLQKKKRFLLRVLISLLAFFGFCYGGAALRIYFPGAFPHILSRQIDYYASLFILFILFDEALHVILMQWCAGMAVSDLAVRIFQLIVVLSGHNPAETISLLSETNEIRDFLICYGIQAIVILTATFLFGREKPRFYDRTTEKNIVVLSFIAALSLGISNGITREFMAESVWLYTVILFHSMLLSCLILLLRARILTQAKYRMEITLLEELLREEKKQYETAKQNVDLINMKVHDLKNRLTRIDDRLTEEEISSLRDAVNIYDSSINTGNEALNVLLYEKQLLCKKEGIQLSCMADGNALGFIRASHLYALFDNAIGNAIEAVNKLSVPDKKLIDLTVRRENNTVLINVSNYCEEKKDTEPLAPHSSKKDVSHHGYGIKSMRYIAEQYQGTLSAKKDKDKFHLIISIPLPQNN